MLKRLARQMPRLRVFLLQRMAGILCQLSPGVHLRRQIPGARPLLREMAHQLSRRKRPKIANQGIESLKRTITPSPTSNTSHRRRTLPPRLFLSWRVFVRPMKALRALGAMSSNTKRMRTIKLISLARYARLWTADEHSLTLDIARPRPQPSSALKRKKK